MPRLLSPRSDWFAALAHAWTKSNAPAKLAVERAAAIGGKPEHAYQACVMRPQLQQGDAALTMLPPLEKRPRPEAEWLAAIANAWILKERRCNAVVSMERAARISDKSDHWHRASQLWLHAENPEKALPPVKR